MSSLPSGALIIVMNPPGRPARLVARGNVETLDGI